MCKVFIMGFYFGPIFGPLYPTIVGPMFGAMLRLILGLFGVAFGVSIEDTIIIFMATCMFVYFQVLCGYKNSAQGNRENLRIGNVTS